MAFARYTTTWAKHVGAGEAYSAENSIVPGGGNTPHVQLFNPVASGIRVRLRSVHAIGTVTISGLVNRYDIALTTLGPPVGFVIENMLGGGPAAVAQMRSQAPVGALGTTFAQYYAAANTPALYPARGREWGQDLLEGQGILLTGPVGAVFIANWQWVEVPL